jgi:hypothetical protein
VKAARVVGVIIRKIETDRMYGSRLKLVYSRKANAKASGVMLALAAA